MKTDTRQPLSVVTSAPAEPPQVGDEQYRAVLIAERAAADYCRAGGDIVGELDGMAASLESERPPSSERDFVRAAIAFEARSFANFVFGRDANDWLYLEQGMAPIVELVEYLRYLEGRDREPHLAHPTLSDPAKRMVTDIEEWFRPVREPQARERTTGPSSLPAEDE